MRGSAAYDQPLPHVRIDPRRYVGLMVGAREPTLRLGVRIDALRMHRRDIESDNGRTAADKINAARRVFIRQFGRS